MITSKTFMDLIVWQKSHQFVLGVYQLTAEFPKSETYGLASQFRRAAVSIPANIAEGYRKQSDQDKARFLNIAEGSLEECRYYLILAHDLGYLNDSMHSDLLHEVSRLLFSYRKAILDRIRSQEPEVRRR